MDTRKQLRLAQHDYSAPGYYFVTICTRDKRHLFGTVVGADVLIGPQVIHTTLGKTVEKTIARMETVEKYVVMPNHVHIIFRITEPTDGPMGTSAPTSTIPRLVRYLKHCVTEEHGANIWQRSYYDHIIRNEEDHRRIWEYIESNPAKWQEDRYYTSTSET